MEISLFYAYFVGHFCYHSNGKVKSMAEFYTWTILLINQFGEIGEKQLSVFGSKGGQISQIKARTPLV